MEDNRAECRILDIEENRSQGVESKKNDNGSNETSEGSSYATLGLDGRSGEGAGGRVCTEKRTKQVCGANSDELLRGINCVVVDSSKGFGDGDMLDEHDNDRRWKLAGKSLDNLFVELGHANLLKASGNILQNAEERIILAMEVDAGADGCIE